MSSARVRGSRVRDGLSRLRRDELGAVSAEHVGTIIVVAAVVAALVVMPLAPLVGAWGQYAICQLFGGDCVRPGLEERLALSDCEISRRYGGFEYGAGAFSVSYSNEVGFETTLLGDGTAHVSYIRGQDVGVGVGVGAEVWVYWGEAEYGAGAVASAGIDVFTNTGDVYGFTNPDDADAWISWTRANKGIIDAVPLVGSDTWGIGWLAGKAHEGVNWTLNRGGWGQDPPPEPELVGSWEEGGLRVSAEARGGVRDGREQEDGPLAYGELQASLSAAEKHYVDHITGEETYLLTSTALMDGTGELGPLGAAFSVGDTSVVAVTVDAERRQPVQLEFLSYRLDESGRDFTGVDDRDAIDRRFGTATASGELGEPSMYEVTTTLDLRDDPDLADALVNPGRAPSNRALQDALDRHAFTTVAEYEVGSERYGASADLGKLLEFSASGGVTRDASDLLDMWVYDPALRHYDRWSDCVEAAA